MKRFIKISALMLVMTMAFAVTMLSASAAKPGKSGILNIELKGEKMLREIHRPSKLSGQGQLLRQERKKVQKCQIIYMRTRTEGDKQLNTMPNADIRMKQEVIEKATSDLNPILKPQIDFTFKDDEETLKKLYGLM